MAGRPPDSRLDLLARELAGGEISRRSALRRLAGGALAAGVASIPGAEALASLRRCPSARRCGDKCCPAHSKCKRGRCKCNDGYTKCGKKCANLQTSAKHCGGCDQPCAVNEACDSGVCRHTCESAGECPPDGQCGIASCPNGLCEYAPNGTIGTACQSGAEPGIAQCNGTEIVCETFCSNPANAGAVCDNGNACVTGTVCIDGVCGGGTAVTCTAQDQCHNAGTCNPATGVCSNPAKPDGSPCNDGDACTQSDTCQGGVCVGAAPVTCTALGQCYNAGTCNPATGVCSNPAKPAGTGCELDGGNPNGICNGSGACVECLGDGNCPPGETCVSGQCQS